MRWKITVSALIAIGLTWIVYGALVDKRNNQAAKDLARQLDRKRKPQEKTSGKKPSASRMIRLADGVTAEWDGDWIVREEGSHAYVALPFKPQPSGDFPPVDEDKQTFVSNNPGFVGPAACAECHRENHDGFVHTGHFQTSGLIDQATLSGHFTSPRNELAVQDSNLLFTLIRQDKRPYQRISLGDWTMDVPMNVATGSSKAGQSYLYWHGDALYQNHVSYLTETGQWIASPGFPERGGIFSRQVTTECLECHVTYIDLKERPNHYHRDSAIWGVTCERCHGPGKQHVDYHRQNPQQRQSKFIVYPKNLPRQRQLDICGQCHSGPVRIRSKPFAFRPGDPLLDHHTSLQNDPDLVGTVHTSNQLTRLERSRCFTRSEMTCTTCHDPHQHQRGDVKLFSQRCLDCHEPAQCGMHTELGDQHTDNCIDCHMPMGETAEMELNTTGSQFSPPMIDHHIRIDRPSTEAYLKALQQDRP